MCQGWLLEAMATEENKSVGHLIILVLEKKVHCKYDVAEICLHCIL